MKRLADTDWTAEDSAELYGVREWGAGYFDLNAQGQVEVCAPFKDTQARVPLLDIVQGMRERGMEVPAMLRISNILDHRLLTLNEAFATAIEKSGYRNHYRGVFPIKVNQQCQVIDEISEYGARYHHGFEAGSKAELVIALASLKDHKSLIICNGYKDSEFVELGLYACQLGIPCFFVVETPAELPVILERSRAMGIKPRIGVRLKLSAKVDGHWQDDSGDRSIFGLSSNQLIEVVDKLKAEGMLDCLELMHFHLGSQLPNIRNIRTGVLEACRYYVDLVKEGAPLGYLDMGGGLAVDYDGSRTNCIHSMNYRLNEYCVDMVEAVMTTLDEHEIAHPVLISESGRSTIAYSSILLFNILDVSHNDPKPVPETLPADSHEMLLNLRVALQAVQPRNLQESYNDAVYYREELHELFRQGQIDLRARALGDNIYLAIVQKIIRLLPEAPRVPQELSTLQDSMADIYYANFSIFQSLPDAWAIDQVFPIMPIHRLDQEPTRQAVIADITCDCDGKMDNFASPNGDSSTLAVHEFKHGDDYYFGTFLVGAYQETLGDLHNLFGDTHVVSVRIHEDGSFEYEQELEGDSIADVLSYVEYHPKSLSEQFRRIAEKAVRSGRITAAQRKQMLNAYDASLRGYTYYEK